MEVCEEVPSIIPRIERYTRLAVLQQRHISAPAQSPLLILVLAVLAFKRKCKVQPRTDNKNPEREQEYSSTLSLTSALCGGGWSTPHSEKCYCYILIIIIVMPKGKIVHFYVMNAQKEKRVTTPVILNRGTTDND